MTTSHYDILGVSRTAPDVVIVAAYRAMMRKHHPDLNKDAAAEEVAKSVTAAYEVLSDPARRAAYDRSLGREDEADQVEPPPPSPRAFRPEPRAPDVVVAAAPAKWGRALVGGAALVLALGAGGLGIKAMASGGASAAASGVLGARPNNIFAAFGAHSGGGARSSRSDPSCATGLKRFLGLPDEIKASFGDLSQILKARGEGGADEGGLKVVRIADPHRCGAPPPLRRDTVASATRHGRRVPLGRRQVD